MKELEKKIHNYLKARKWDSPLPSNVAKSIMIEGAELLELFQWENLPVKEIKKNKAKIEEIKKELADVLIYTIQLSMLFGFDTQKIILDKLKKVEEKYPAKAMRNRKRNSGNSEYWKIKKDHRGGK